MFNTSEYATFYFVGGDMLSLDEIKHSKDHPVLKKQHPKLYLTYYDPFVDESTALIFLSFNDLYEFVENDGLPAWIEEGDVYFTGHVESQIHDMTIEISATKVPYPFGLYEEETIHELYEKSRLMDDSDIEELSTEQEVVADPVTYQEQLWTNNIYKWNLTDEDT